MKLTPDPRNPNQIDKESKRRMAKTLPEFGDLGGIILNRRTGYLIGGHQRTDIMAGAVVESEDLPEPELDGTVARGWVVYKGRRFALRVVDWDEGKAKAAMVAANRFGRVGSDETDTLKELLGELDEVGFDMDLTGFDEDFWEEINKPKMKHLEIDTPPKMAWVLIGVPLGEWVKVSPLAEAAAAIDGSIVETTANDGI